MRKKLILLILVVAIGTASVSCFKKNKNDKKDNQSSTNTTEQINTNGQVNTDIFNSGNNPTGNSNITNLTPEEQQFLINNKIDPLKVSEAITKAEGGDKESILSLAQLYFNLKDNEKTKKYLQMGADRNYPEAIYNLAVLLKQEGNDAEAAKLIARLPKGTATRSRQIRPGAQAYNNGVDLIKAGKYEKAKAQFISAYNQGIKEADIKIALLNKETKNYSEALKWFKSALARGETAANLEIGAILYDTGKMSEARPYLIKAYNSGNRKLATYIAATYHKENNTSEALKWYKTAAKNGDGQAKEIIAQIENGGKAGEKGDKSLTFLSDGSQMGSLTDSTLAKVKKENSKSETSGEKGLKIEGDNTKINIDTNKENIEKQEKENKSTDTGAEKNKNSEVEKSAEKKEEKQEETDKKLNKTIENAVKRGQQKLNEKNK